MDFIEQWFNFSPDDGDGAVEVLLIIALVIAVASISRSIWQSKHSTR